MTVEPCKSVAIQVAIRRNSSGASPQFKCPRARLGRLFVQLFDGDVAEAVLESGPASLAAVDL